MFYVYVYFVSKEVSIDFNLVLFSMPAKMNYIQNWGSQELVFLRWLIQVLTQMVRALQSFRSCG